ncbi:hypothetical protein CHARACLAT_026868, partial [Characodon lateralis]|nr:hypothetical protein [Characodon lateralis]
CLEVGGQRQGGFNCLYSYLNDKQASSHSVAAFLKQINRLTVPVEEVHSTGVNRADGGETEKFSIGVKRRTQDLSVAKNGGKHKIRKYDEAYLALGFTVNGVGNEERLICVLCLKTQIASNQTNEGGTWKR